MPGNPVLPGERRWQAGGRAIALSALGVCEGQLLSNSTNMDTYLPPLTLTRQWIPRPQARAATFLLAGRGSCR
ncbi:uncharacterized protein MYCFIDRAFT_179575 [Pseudocercospora fijiensis CIRAD86]|uniref:Uncharacterized protein n=1 Tax=Pseudocercospora fijiensis (strain CIRAD86) TaxID=383855 RepID=M3A163_PSEFD|nr:uncharacterized protein MYCFIDRAFT_179575 [Pseudocercospora fijiensis CIRAD86]EME78131.1 hypothetical protein MYCFIDRAFT_179575 [Pseudocercospora fijiensis CIRAD86]